MRNIFLISFYLIITFSVKCQDSIHFYGDSLSVTSSRCVAEVYDKGYLISGVKNKGLSGFGWIQKTSINGNALWNKSYGNIGKRNGFGEALITNDGGFICIGSSDKIYSNCMDPMVTKINACGEKEWCKIYNSQNCNAGGLSITSAPNGGYMILVQDWIGNPDVWLFRLDETGGVIWTQQYVSNPQVFWSPVGSSVIRTTDSCFLITGEAYSPDSVYPGNLLLKIFHIKVDNNGNLIYENPWGNNNGIISEGKFSIEDNHHNIYTVGDRPSGTSDVPCLFKTAFSGQPEFYHDLKGAVYISGSSSINWFADSTIVMEAFWRSYMWGIDTLALIKTNANGAIINQKSIFTDTSVNVYGGRSCITYNDRVVLAGSLDVGDGNIKAYLVKLRNDLSFDSVYLQPVNYDSLCPHPIISDTISLNDCDVVTSVYDPKTEPEKSALRIFPNPAKGYITIELPQFLVRNNKTPNFSTTTVYQQWDSALLDIYDLFGKLVFRQQINQKTGKINPEISNWQSGMYVVRLIFKDQCLASGKFVIEK